VVCHPGFFFDCDDDGLLVLSLLVPGAALVEAARRLVALSALG
jgi:hypothetical protein